MLIQINNGAIKSRYPHHRNQTGFVGDTWASSPIVRDQFLKIESECRIDNDGIRSSIKSAITLTTANKIQPARRSRTKSDRPFSRKAWTITKRKRTSGS